MRPFLGVQNRVASEARNRVASESGPMQYLIFHQLDDAFRTLQLVLKKADIQLLN